MSLVQPDASRQVVEWAHGPWFPVHLMLVYAAFETGLRFGIDPAEKGGTRHEVSFALAVGLLLAAVLSYG